MITMSEYPSRYVHVLERLSEAILKDKSGKFQVPIYYDIVELTPHKLPPTCIAFEGKPFGLDKTQCMYERQLDIVIMHSTKNKRDITLRLSAFAESLKGIIDEVIMFGGDDFELKFLQGSEIGYLENAKKDSENYKATKTLLTSFIVLSYLVRY